VTQREDGIIVVDDVLDDPDAHRCDALACPFRLTGHFPGRRSDPGPVPALEHVVASLVAPQQVAWPDGTDSGSFQSVPASSTTWVHADDRTTHTGILYLTPEPPPRSGTSFFTHRPTGARWLLDEVTDAVNADAALDAAWVEDLEVENVYNRLVVFPGTRLHRSTGFFGCDLRDARLTQVLFFDLSDPASR